MVNKQIKSFRSIIKQILHFADDRLQNLQIAFEKDKARAITDARKQCESEKQRAIELTRRETKKQTWCSSCTKEARFYCCWNTSYCGQQCQRTHSEKKGKGQVIPIDGNSAQEHRVPKQDEVFLGVYSEKEDSKRGQTFRISLENRGDILRDSIAHVVKMRTE